MRTRRSPRRSRSRRRRKPKVKRPIPRRKRMLRRTPRRTPRRKPRRRCRRGDCPSRIGLRWSKPKRARSRKRRKTEEAETVKEKEKRDRSKTNKFNFLMACGSVPQSVQNTYKNMTGPGSRIKQTQFINAIIQRDPGGNLQLAGTKRATVAGAQRLRNEKSFEMEDKGMSQTLIMNKFNMTPEALKEAFNNGEVDIAYHSGKPYVSWRILRSRNKDSKSTDIDLQGKRMAISEREAGQMQSLLDDINLELPTELPDMPNKPMIADGDSGSGTGTGSGSGSGSAGPAAEEKAMTTAKWAKTKELAEQGVTTCGQLQGKELPKKDYPGEVTFDKVNAFLQQQVLVMKGINEDIAGVRGKLDVRAKGEKKKEWRRVLGPQPEVCYGEYLAVMVRAAEVVYKEPPKFVEGTTFFLDRMCAKHVWEYPDGDMDLPRWI
ncbi:unnamed protein product, partial [Symbiodinium necroappetens]